MKVHIDVDTKNDLTHTLVCNNTSQRTRLFQLQKLGRICIEYLIASIRLDIEHPFRAIKQQFRFLVRVFNPVKKMYVAEIDCACEYVNLGLIDLSSPEIGDIISHLYDYLRPKK